MVFACFGTSVAAQPKDSVVVQNVDSAAVQPAITENDPVAVLNAEIALRDSIMGARDSSCSVEKQSLRNSLELEQAKCENWEQSYNTIKKNNEVCAQALSVSLGVSEKKKEEVEDERRKASTMTTTSFLGGIAVGMLLFWLIFE